MVTCLYTILGNFRMENDELIEKIYHSSNINYKLNLIAESFLCLQEIIEQGYFEINK